MIAYSFSFLIPENLTAICIKRTIDIFKKNLIGVINFPFYINDVNMLKF